MFTLRVAKPQPEYVTYRERYKVDLPLQMAECETNYLRLLKLLRQHFNKQVEEQNQGTALGTYSAFLDLALGITGPVAGWIAGYYQLDSIYLIAAIVVALAFILILRVHLAQRKQLILQS